MIELFRRIMSLPTGASSVSDGVDTLHAVIAISAAVVFVILALYGTVLVIRYRRVRPDQATERVEASGKTEFTIVAFVTIAFVAYWVVGFKQYGEMTVPPADAEIVYVEAKQWMWKFGYPNGRSSEDVLTVPVNKPIKLVMTSRDVIHSFYVPAFRVKRDAVPGRTNITWFEATKPGTYPIYCAEYCGVSHSAMLGSVRVLSPDDYAAWAQTVPSHAERGEELAHRYGCIACHSTPSAPKLNGIYGQPRTLADGRSVLADDAYLTRAMMAPNADVTAGFQPGMPTYRGVLDPGDVGPILDWLRGLK